MNCARRSKAGVVMAGKRDRRAVVAVAQNRTGSTRLALATFEQAREQHRFIWKQGVSCSTGRNYWRRCRQPYDVAVPDLDQRVRLAAFDRLDHRRRLRGERSRRELKELTSREHSARSQTIWCVVQQSSQPAESQTRVTENGFLHHSAKCPTTLGGHATMAAPWSLRHGRGRPHSRFPR